MLDAGLKVLDSTFEILDAEFKKRGLRILCCGFYSDSRQGHWVRCDCRQDAGVVVVLVSRLWTQDIGCLFEDTGRWIQDARCSFQGTGFNTPDAGFKKLDGRFEAR
eukprot:TRINITY_DN168_c0_g1_i12.p2 TRINITY_DN168_c0_g1~~TRINITY_DN168_c0_g1_i12.p2  ORF type:complete len:106 (+),score=19.65 TRINITY_DN168_c0_g1_i12:528-845(+)